MTLRWDSYSDQDYDWDTASDRIVRELDRAWAERRAMYGDSVPGGWTRPTVPMCSAHNYGLVDGKCGVCIQEARMLAVADEESKADLGAAA